MDNEYVASSDNPGSALWGASAPQSHVGQHAPLNAEQNSVVATILFAPCAVGTA